MILDNTIKHYEEMITEKREEYQECLAVHDMENAEECGKCGEQCEQLVKWLKDYKRLLEQEPCEDAISRKEVLEMIEQIQDAGGFIGYNTYSEAFDRVDNMTLITPTRKKGKWIDTEKTNINQRGQIIHEVICSECNGISYFRSMGNKYIGANLCPNCGDKKEL